MSEELENALLLETETMTAHQVKQLVYEVSCLLIEIGIAKTSGTND